MALTLNGSTNWPDRKALTRLGQTRCDLSLSVINTAFEQAADVLATLAPEVRMYFNGAAMHREMADKLLAAWQTGVRDSLGLADRSVASS
jgi:serine/threonine-protein kinase HipA